MRRNHDHSTNYTFQIHGIFWQVVHHIFYFTKVCGEIPNIFPPATSELENHSAKCTFWPSSLPPPSPCSLIFQPSFKLTELSAFFPYQQFCNFVKKTSNQQNNTKDWISNPEANEGTVPQLSHFTNCISPNVSIVFLPLCQLYFSYCANCISPMICDCYHADVLVMLKPGSGGLAMVVFVLLCQLYFSKCIFFCQHLIKV